LIGHSSFSQILLFTFAIFDRPAVCNRNQVVSFAQIFVCFPLRQVPSFIDDYVFLLRSIFIFQFDSTSSFDMKNLVDTGCFSSMLLFSIHVEFQSEIKVGLNLRWWHGFQLLFIDTQSLPIFFDAEFPIEKLKTFLFFKFQLSWKDLWCSIRSVDLCFSILVKVFHLALAISRNFVIQVDTGDLQILCVSITLLFLVLLFVVIEFALATLKFHPN